MSIHEKKPNIANNNLLQTELHLYGSSRLGVLKTARNVQTTGIVAPVNEQLTGNYTRGSKLFELSNHLGNVLVTITDKKIQIPNSTAQVGSTIQGYMADIATAQDYYPFGDDDAKYQQIRSMIDILSEQKGAYVTTYTGQGRGKKYDANVKASDYGAAVLVIITPSNGLISPAVVEYATQKKVQLYQRITQVDTDNPDRIRVAANVGVLNTVQLSEGNGNSQLWVPKPLVNRRC